MNRQLRAPNPFRHRWVLVAAGLLLTATVAAEPRGPGPYGDKGMAAHLDRMAEQLDLTEAQRGEIEAILAEQRSAAASRREETRERIDAVLTDEQRATRDTRRAERMERRLGRMTKRLDLTEAQQQEIRAIFEARQSGTAFVPGALREELAAVLTDEQRARLTERRGRGGRRGYGDRPRRGQADGGDW